MSFIIPKNIINEYPNNFYTFINNSKDTIKSILSYNDKRLLVIVGPCSVHNINEILDYAKLFKKAQKKYEKNLYLVLRLYGEKPRSTGLWKGFINDPDLNNTNNIKKGIIEYRKLCLKLLEMEIPLATEMLCPLTFNYFKDLISYCAIGART